MEEDRLEVARREAQTLCRRILEDGLPEEAELTYSGRNRLYAVPLKCGVTANVKVFKRPGALRGIIYGIFARPKSLKSFVNARRLLSQGISTPEPLAHLEERIWGGLRLARSMYVCVHDEDTEEIRCWERREDRDELVEALGREMARLTAAGVLFRDFSPGNVLLRRDGSGTFTFVDVNRTDFNVPEDDDDVPAHQHRPGGDGAPRAGLRQSTRRGREGYGDRRSENPPPLPLEKRRPPRHPQKNDKAFSPQISGNQAIA